MSSIVTWATLNKLIDDLTTIEEQIDADIATHDEDNDAHNTEGGSLYGHRTQTPADHPDGSISTALLADNAVTAAKIEAQEDWTDVSSFLNSWVNFGTGYNTAGYMKDSLGFVHLKGLIISGTINANAFNLPEGYRPEKELLLPTASNGAFGYVQITVGGDVKPKVGSNVWFSIECITFKAA